MKYLVFIIAMLIMFLIFMPIRLKIDIRKEKVDIDILLFGLFGIRLDVDEFTNKYLRDKNKKISLHKILNFIKVSNKLKKMYLDIMKYCVIEQFTCRMDETFELPYFVIFSKMFYLNVKSFIENKFKNVLCSEYQIQLSEKRDFNLTCICRIYLSYLIYIALKNIKDIIKTRKYLKEENKNESSN